jgi:hypothetical protein
MKYGLLDDKLVFLLGQLDDLTKVVGNVQGFWLGECLSITREEFLLDANLVLNSIRVKCVDYKLGRCVTLLLAMSSTCFCSV